MSIMRTEAPVVSRPAAAPVRGASSPAVVDPDARCLGAAIGAGTTVGAFSRLEAGVLVGDDCVVADRVLVAASCFVGNRVTLDTGATIAEAAVVEDDVYVGPGVQVVTRALAHGGVPGPLAPVVLGAGCCIGAGAVVLPGVVVGRSAVIGAGAVVTRDVPAHATVTGNPGRVTGYATTAPPATPPTASPVRAPQRWDAGPGGSRVLVMPGVTDLRGHLAHAETGADLPFVPQRVFHVYGVPSAKLRGEHAHHRCEQLLMCVSGSIRVVVDDGTDRAEVLLEDPRQALHLPAMVWATEYAFTSDAVLVVLASHRYDAADYIRDYPAYLAALAARRSAS